MVFDIGNDDNEYDGPPLIQPPNSVAVNHVVYVHGQGLCIRSHGVPGSDPDHYMSVLEAREMLCDHSAPIIFCFTAYYPSKPGVVYMVHTLDYHQAMDLLVNPQSIKMHAVAGLNGYAVNLIDGDGRTELAVIEFNSFISRFMKNDDSPVPDDGLSVDSLQDVDSLFDEIDDFLKSITDNNEGDSNE